jgi:hypothetical protein
MCADHKAVNPLTGRRFGKLLVLERAGSDKDHRALWLCACECGERKVVSGKSLTSGNTTTCGCGKQLAMATARAARRPPHPAARKRAYSIWGGMLSRCSDPKNPQFKNYGGRGITVCAQWLEFECFLADMGLPPDGLSIDRVDNDRGYEPGNCRWATAKEQARNKRTNVFVEFNGERLTVQEWAARLGSQHTALRRRLKLWGVELALTTPVTKKKPHLFRKGAVDAPPSPR